MTPTECGLAALAMVLGTYGHFVRREELRDLLGPGVVDAVPTDVDLRVRARPGETAKGLARQLSPFVLNLHRGVPNVHFDGLDDGENTQDLLLEAIAAMLLACGAVAMIVGAMNVANAQLIAVRERTVEYAIRRALGLPARALWRGVVLESVAMTFVGSVVGVGVGLAAAYGAGVVLSATVTPWTFHVVPLAAVGAVEMALVARLVAGWYPARVATSAPLAESLSAT